MFFGARPNYAENAGDARGARAHASPACATPAHPPAPPADKQRAPRPREDAARPPAANAGGRPSKPTRVVDEDGTEFELDHGAVVIAAITSCTNTSNPQVMIGAALLARNAVERGLSRKPWVKTTLAPGSKVVMDYYD